MTLMLSTLVPALQGSPYSSTPKQPLTPLKSALAVASMQAGSTVAPLYLAVPREAQASPHPSKQESTNTASSSPSHTLSATTNKHWLNDVGYKIYGSITFLKQATFYNQSLSHGNPTFAVGATGLLAALPFVAMSHNLSSNMAMLLAFHICEMADASITYNTLSGLNKQSAETAGIHVQGQTAVSSSAMKYLFESPAERYIRLTGTVLSKAEIKEKLEALKKTPDDALHSQVLGWEASPMRRLISGKGLTKDTQALSELGQWLIEDQKQATQQFIKINQQLGRFAVDIVKHIVDAKHPITPPPLFKLLAPAGDYAAKATALENAYHLQNAGAFAGIVGVLAEGTSHVLGISTMTKPIVRTWLLGSNLLQSVGLINTTQQLWHQEQLPKWGRKIIAPLEGVGAILCAVGAASWSNDTLLGLYRLGSLFQSPLRVIKLFYTTDPQTRQLSPKLMSRADWAIVASQGAILGLDALSAAAIIGSPAVKHYEATHHTSLNPWKKPKSAEKQAHTQG
jgi:hypothetical protein